MKVIDVRCCFCFLFTFSFYRVTNNNKILPKKKQKLCTSLAEHQQLLEDFHNDFDDETFLGHEFGGEGEDESNISCSSSDTDVDVSDKDTDCTSQPVNEDDLLPTKQKFKNLDDVFDLNNYDILPPQEPITFHYSDAKGQFVMDSTTIKQVTSVGRAPNQNVIKHKPGPRRQAKQVTDSLETFSLFITDNMLTTIVEYTNSKIKNFRRKFENIIVNSNKYTHCGITDLTEIKAFIGIFYIHVALKVNIHNSNQIWYHESSDDLFVTTMSLKRFCFLTRFTEFDDKGSREKRWHFDKFACIKRFF